MHTFAAGIYSFVGRYDVAFAALRHAFTLDPEHFPAHTVLGHVYDRTGDTDAALESYRTAHRLSRGNAAMLGFQGSVLGRVGRDVDARQIAATLEQTASSRHVPPSVFAPVFAGLGDHDTAFHPSGSRMRIARRVPHHADACALVGTTPFRRTIRQPLRRTGSLPDQTAAR